MKRLSFILTVLSVTLFCPHLVWAEPVSESEAQQQAVAFLTGRGRLSIPVGAPSRVRNTSDEPQPYYVFNLAADNGFVIVSGDDRVAPILGYADQGTIDVTHLPDGLRFMLDSYAEQIARLDNLSSTSASLSSDPAALSPARTQSPTRTPIAPLVATRWNQGNPYNLNCPTITNQQTQETTQCVTGCVATAMAQAMKYHNYPTAPTAVIPGYTSRNKIHTLDALPATTLDWSNMTNTYSSSATDAQKAAVATLMQYCGWSVEMNYNTVSGSFNKCVAYALKTYFDYDPGLRYVMRQNYTYLEWIDLIYSELAASRPVVLGGQAASGGHSFVCDGYDADDYFHINWGWGGSSDGYFRLSLLNPWEQGIGGSSTLDGFTYEQDAVIGIRPNASSGKSYALMLTGLRHTRTGTETTKTYMRESASESFTDVNFFVSIQSIQAGTHSYDAKMLMVPQSDGTTYNIYESLNQAYELEKNVNHEVTLTLPSVIPNGTYTLQVKTRPYTAEGTEPWSDCYEADRFTMTATITDTQLTLTTTEVASTNPTCTGITYSGKQQVGYEDTVMVHLSGGASAYSGPIFLYVDKKKVIGRHVNIEAGTNADVQLVYTPSKVNAKTPIDIYADATKIRYVDTVAISSSLATNTQTLTAAPTIANLSGSTLYGNVLVLTATITNSSSDSLYVGRVNCSCREYASADAEEFTGGNVQSHNVEIPVSGSVQLSFSYSGLTAGKYYRLRFTYTQGYYDKGSKKTKTADALLTDAYLMAEGYCTYQPDGTFSYAAKPESGTIDCSSAAFVDFSGMGDFGALTITPSTNPNCLYLLAADAETPASLSGKNIIKGSSAESVTLTHGTPFYTPMAFTASAISYTRTFTLAAAKSSGWNTLYIPFTVQSIHYGNDNRSADWFHSASDAGKNFWLRAFSADDAGTIYFDYADALLANTPYLIAVPGSGSYDDKWRMTDKPVTFSATDVTIQPTQDGSVSGNHYAFYGSATNVTVQNVYTLNATGSEFTKQTSQTALPPFSAWVCPVTITELSLPAISIGSQMPTDLFPLHEEQPTSDDAWYTITGLLLSAKPTIPGAYIHQGKVQIIP